MGVIFLRFSYVCNFNCDHKQVCTVLKTTTNKEFQALKKVKKNKKIRNQLFVHTTNRILKKSLQYLQNPKSRKNKNG